MNFNMKLDDDIAAVLDADREGLYPRRSRTAHIEAILYEAYKDEVDQLRATRQQAEASEAPDLNQAVMEIA